MAFLAALGPIATAISAAGTIVGGLAGMAQGNAQAAQMEHRAKMEQQAAMEARAIGTRQAAEKRRQGDLVQSTLQARAAASGAGAADPTIIALGQDIAGRSEYDALFDMSRAENRARGFEDSAQASLAAAKSAETQGKFALFGSLFKAGGTLIGGSGSMQNSYYPSASGGSGNSIDDYLYGRRGSYG